MRVGNVKRLMLRTHSQQARAVQVRRELQVDQRIAASGGDVTLGTVGVQIGPNSGLQVRPPVGWVNQPGIFFRSARQDADGTRLLAQPIFHTVAGVLEEPGQCRFLASQE